MPGYQQFQNAKHQIFKNVGSTISRRVNTFHNRQPTKACMSNALGFPDELDVTLAYSNSLQLQSAVGEQQMIYEGNNPWDPDPQLGGRSADQYSIFKQVYRYCRVYGSSIEVNYNIINQEGFQCTVAPLAENDPISYEMLMVLPRSKTGRLVNAAGITSSRIVNDANTAGLFGINNLDWDVSNSFSLENTGSSAIEPARKWYWHVAFQTNESQNILNGSAKIRIFYRCHFYGRKFQSQLSTVTDDGDDDIPVLEPGSGGITIDDPPNPIVGVKPLNVAQFIDRPKNPLSKIILEGDDLSAFLSQKL